MASNYVFRSSGASAITFNTDAKELMEIISGDLEVTLPGEERKEVKGGESFEVPAKSKFNLKIRETADYCCSFIQ